MNPKYLIIAAIAFIAFVAGLFYLKHLDETTPTATESRFIPYATQIGLDLDRFNTDLAGSVTEARVNADLAEANAKQVRSTPTFYINDQQMSLANDVEEIKRIIDGLEATEVREIPEGVHYKGSSTPKTVIVEYSDLQCPACGSYAAPLKDYIAQYGESDAVALVYKQFPLMQIHPRAFAAAKATEAAALQGKFWEMHDVLFENQKEWSR